MDEFKPKNNVQKLAYEKRGITTRREFEQMIQVKPWKVARTTARHWWEKGIKMPTLSTLLKLSDFFKVSLDDLVNEEKKGN
jgi:transcriptional regulator with XRE-family HTH domain